MILLQEKGFVSASGEIKKSGTKKTGLILEDNNMALNLDDLLKENLKLIKNAFDKKIVKTYDADTSLLIMFKNVVTFDEDHVIEQLREFVEKEICSQNDKFENIYLVSWSGEICIIC